MHAAEVEGVEIPPDAERDVSDLTTVLPDPLITPLSVPPILLLTGLGMTEDSKLRVSAVVTVAVTPDVNIVFSFLVGTSILDFVFVDGTEETGLSMAGALCWLSSRATRVTCPS